MMKEATRRRPDPAKEQTAVDDWNRDHQVGALVTVKLDDGSNFETETTGAAALVSNMAVVWVKGITGCYQLSRVKPRIVHSIPLAEAIKDPKYLIGTIGMNVACLMTRAIEADSAQELEHHESLATLLLTALFEMNGISATLVLPDDAATFEKTIHRLAPAFGFDPEKIILMPRGEKPLHYKDHQGMSV